MAKEKYEISFKGKSRVNNVLLKIENQPVRLESKDHQEFKNSELIIDVVNDLDYEFEIYAFRGTDVDVLFKNLGSDNAVYEETHTTNNKGEFKKNGKCPVK